MGGSLRVFFHVTFLLAFDHRIELRCVPSLVQFPIFIGLYRSILKLSQINPKFQEPGSKYHNSELRGKPFESLEPNIIFGFGWLGLNVHFVLAILYPESDSDASGAIPVDSQPCWTHAGHSQLGQRVGVANGLLV